MKLVKIESTNYNERMLQFRVDDSIAQQIQEKLDGLIAVGIMFAWKHYARRGGRGEYKSLVLEFHSQSRNAHIDTRWRLSPKNDLLKIEMGHFHDERNNYERSGAEINKQFKDLEDDVLKQLDLLVKLVD